MNPVNTKYFMEDAREAARLSAKVDPPAWVERYLSSLLKDGTDVLDVGCGPGVIASAVACVNPQSKVIGIDQSTQRIASGQSVEIPSNLSLRSGDARALPFKDDSFDLVYTRFMLEYVKSPQDIVGEILRVCRPGGRVLLQDLDGQLLWHYPEDEELQAQISKVVAALSKTGFDPFVGRKLFWLAKTAGLQNIQVQAESYHLFAGRIDDHNLKLWEMKLDIAMPAAAIALGSESAAQSLKKKFLDYLRREDTLTYSIVFTVNGSK
jgi:ubiquinone/menaquinone biosynthesis C-methylase UbiE